MKAVRALSYSRPWAWITARGWKPPENRPWPLWKYFQREDLPVRIYIQSAKSFDYEATDFILKRLTEEQQGEFMAAKHVAGAIIGEITITDCVKECDSIWFFGPYTFMQKDAELYKTPVPCRGQLGFFYPPRDVIEQIEKMKTSQA